MRRALLTPLVAFGLASAASAQDAPAAAMPTIELPAELDRVLRDYERAWQAGDVAALAALFTEDGFVTGPGGWVRGSAAIRDRYAGMSGGDLRLRAHAWSTADTVGYIVGSYGYALGPDVTDGGVFVLALRRRPGEGWRIAADIDRSNRD
jgi:ketosteroid isomerase-like protein